MLSRPRTSSTTVYEPRPMPSTFLLMSFSVLVLNKSAIVIGLYKVIKGLGQSSILQLSLLCHCRQTFQTRILQVSKIEVLKTYVQSTCDANQLFYTSRSSMSSAHVNELVHECHKFSFMPLINSAVQGQRTNLPLNFPNP